MIDPAAMPGFAEDEAARQLIAGEWFGATRWAARSAELIDYGAAAACKRVVLEALWRSFCAVDLGGGDLGGGDASATDRAREFRLFQRNGGRDLRDFATFEALHEHHCRDRRGFSWRNWPAPLRNPRSREVTDFAAAHRDRGRIFPIPAMGSRPPARRGRGGRPRRRAVASGFTATSRSAPTPTAPKPGPIRSWWRPRPRSARRPTPEPRRARIGAWPPVNPLVLRRQRFAPFIACLRANMRHSGVLRIDHVMALRRLYWIPNGMAATAGRYVSYPFEDLLRLVAPRKPPPRLRSSSARISARCPRVFAETMRAANVLSYRILIFERRRDGGFVPPSEYPRAVGGSAATHDLPPSPASGSVATSPGAARSASIPMRDAEAAETAERARDRRLLLDALAARDC